MAITVTTDSDELATLRFGHYAGNPIAGASANEIGALLLADQAIYASRFATLWSELRDPDAALEQVGARGISASGSSQDALPWAFALAWAVYRLPDVLPGSDGVATGSGSTVATRGAVRLRWCGEGCEVAIRVRTITLAGTYGQSTTAGTPTTATVSETAGVTGWYEVDCLLPSGVSGGSDIAIDVLYRPAREITPPDPIGVWAGTLTGVVAEWRPIEAMETI